MDEKTLADSIFVNESATKCPPNSQNAMYNGPPDAVLPRYQQVTGTDTKPKSISLALRLVQWVFGIILVLSFVASAAVAIYLSMTSNAVLKDGNELIKMSDSTEDVATPRVLKTIYQMAKECKSGTYDQQEFCLEQCLTPVMKLMYEQIETVDLHPTCSDDVFQAAIRDILKAEQDSRFKQIQGEQTGDHDETNLTIPDADIKIPEIVNDDPPSLPTLHKKTTIKLVLPESQGGGVHQNLLPSPKVSPNTVADEEESAVSTGNEDSITLTPAPVPNSHELLIGENESNEGGYDDKRGRPRLDLGTNKKKRFGDDWDGMNKIPQTGPFKKRPMTDGSFRKRPFKGGPKKRRPITDAFIGEDNSPVNDYYDFDSALGEVSKTADDAEAKVGIINRKTGLGGLFPKLKGNKLGLALNGGKTKETTRKGNVRPASVTLRPGTSILTENVIRTDIPRYINLYMDSFHEVMNSFHMFSKDQYMAIKEMINSMKLLTIKFQIALLEMEAAQMEYIGSSSQVIDRDCANSFHRGIQLIRSKRLVQNLYISPRCASLLTNLVSSNTEEFISRPTPVGTGLKNMQGMPMMKPGFADSTSMSDLHVDPFGDSMHDLLNHGDFDDFDDHLNNDIQLSPPMMDEFDHVGGPIADVDPSAGSIASEPDQNPPSGGMANRFSGFMNESKELKSAISDGLDFANLQFDVNSNKVPDHADELIEKLNGYLQKD